MAPRTSVRSALGFALPLLALLGLAALTTQAQQDRIAGPVDPGHLQTLQGSLHPLARPEYDRGSVEPSFPLPYIALMLKPSPAQSAALDQLLAGQQDPASVNYRRWLTPEEYAGRFGASPADISRIAAWLSAEGFTIERTARGRDWIAFSGTAAQVESAFHTPVHRYEVGGKMHYAIAAEPSIPANLKPIIGAIVGWNDFHPVAFHHRARPRPYFTSGSGDHTLAPGDLTTIYDVNPLYPNVNGAGQKIAIVGQTRVILSDMQAFRSAYGLPSVTVQTILAGTDPGIDAGFLEEADLDLEWSGAIAPGAALLYLYGMDADFAAIDAIDQDLAPVISESYGTCEPQVPASVPPVYETAARKANSLGVTWLAASGDLGAATCDDGANAAKLGLAVSFPASVPEVTAVGGTQLDDTNGTYWTTTNAANGGSALSYIPEMAWNDTAYGFGLSATGGGVSIYYSKPSWQAGTGVPDDNFRDVPDVSLDASNDHDPYNVYSDGVWDEVGGTSVATPMMAGIVALLNQYLTAGSTAKPGVGNFNTGLYPLAQSFPEAFHDITLGNNIVPCQSGTLDCSKGKLGYSTTAGYDAVTGLGSVDAYNLVLNWTGAPAGKASITSLSPSSTTAGAASLTLTVQGSNFTSSAIVNWNGTPLSTTFVSSTEVTASVGSTMLGSPGTAGISVTSAGSISDTLFFTVEPSTPPAVPYVFQRVSTDAPPAAGCVTPPARTIFSTADTTVYLYFNAQVSSNDVISTDWLAPDGSTVSGMSWSPQAGDFCFAGAKLPIGTLTAAQIGAWNARVFDNGTLLFSVPFTVVTVAGEVPVIASVKNAANYASGTVSPGEIVVLFGFDLGPAQIAGLALTGAGLVSSDVAGTIVKFNGVAAPLIYTLDSQVAAIVPYEVSGASSAQVTVTYQGVTSVPFTVSVGSQVPALFTTDFSGSGQLAALNQDSSINSRSNPAPSGSIIVLYATGEGQTSPAGVDGKIATSTLPKPLADVSVTIGGVSAKVDYAGAAPGEVAGVMQVNATIPAGIFGDAVPVAIQVGNAQSEAFATVVIAPPASESAFTVTEKETAASVDSSGNGLTCTAPASKTAFLTTDSAVWVYLAFSGAKTGDVLEFNWVHPDGTVDALQPSITIGFAGSGCAGAGFPIANGDAASDPGNWQVRVSYNKKLQFTLAFTISTPVAVFKVTAKETAAGLIKDSSGNPVYCSMPAAKTAFLTTDTAVWAWFTYDGAHVNDTLSYHWIHPDGTVDSYQPSQALTFSGSGCSAWSFDIAGTPAAADPGNWQVHVFRNGTFEFSLPFSISAPN